MGKNWGCIGWGKFMGMSGSMLVEMGRKLRKDVVDIGEFVGHCWRPIGGGIDAPPPSTTELLSVACVLPVRKHVF